MYDGPCRHAVMIYTSGAHLGQTCSCLFSFGAPAPMHGLQPRCHLLKGGFVCITHHLSLITISSSKQACRDHMHAYLVFQ